MPIPKFIETGELPPGIHLATLKEVEAKFGRSTDKRRSLLNGLRKAINQFKQVGVQSIFIDGSFTTDKRDPGDIDGCWSTIGVDENLLSLLDKDFWRFDTVEEFNKSRDEIKRKFGLDFYIAEHIEGESGKPFPEFFQTNRNGKAKGIIEIKL